MATTSTSTPPLFQANGTSQPSTIPKRPLENANGEDSGTKRRYLGKHMTERALSLVPAYVLHALICAAHDYAGPALSKQRPNLSPEVLRLLHPCPREQSVHGLTPEVQTEVEEVVTEVLGAAGTLREVLESALELGARNSSQLEQMARGRPLTVELLMQELLESSETLRHAMSSLKTRTTGSCGVLAPNHQRHDDNLITLPTISVTANSAYQPWNGPSNTQVQRIAHEAMSHSGAPTPVVEGRSSAVLQATTDTQSAQGIVDGVGPSSDGQGQLDSESAGHAEASMRSEGGDVEMYENDDETVDEETAVEEGIVTDMSQRRAKTAASKPTGGSAQRGPAKAQAVVSREASEEPEGSQNSDDSALSEAQTSQTNTRAPKPRKAPSKKNPQPPNRAKTAKGPTVVNAVLPREASPEPEESQDSKDQKAKKLAAALWGKYVDQELPQPLFTLRLSLQAYDSVDAQQPYARDVLMDMFEHEYTEKSKKKDGFSNKCNTRVKGYLKVFKHLASAFSREGLDRLQSARMEVRSRFSKEREETTVQKVAELCSDQHVAGCIKAMAFLSRGKCPRDHEAKRRFQTIEMHTVLHNDYKSMLHKIETVSVDEARALLLQWALEHGLDPEDPDLTIAMVGQVGKGKADILAQLFRSILSRHHILDLNSKGLVAARTRALWVSKVVEVYTPSIFLMVDRLDDFINAADRELRTKATMELFLGSVQSSLPELLELSRNGNLLLQEQHVFRKVELSSLLDLSNLTDDTLATLDEDEGEGGDAHGADTNSEVTEAEENEATDDTDEVGDQDGLRSTDGPEDELSGARSDISSSHAQLSSPRSERPTRNVSPGRGIDENAPTDNYGDQSSIDDVAGSHTSNSGRCTVATGSLSDKQPKAAVETSEPIVVPGVPQNAAPADEPMDMDVDESNNILSTPVAAPVAQSAASSDNWSSIIPEALSYRPEHTQIMQSGYPPDSDSPSNHYAEELLGSHFEAEIWYKQFDVLSSKKNGEN